MNLLQFLGVRTAAYGRALAGQTTPTRPSASSTARSGSTGPAPARLPSLATVLVALANVIQ